MNLYNYDNGMLIRVATEEEFEASLEASLLYGGVGVILLDVDGVDVRCYAN